MASHYYACDNRNLFTNVYSMTNFAIYLWDDFFVINVLYIVLYWKRNLNLWLKRSYFDRYNKSKKFTNNQCQKLKCLYRNYFFYIVLFIYLFIYLYFIYNVRVWYCKIVDRYFLIDDFSLIKLEQLENIARIKIQFVNSQFHECYIFDTVRADVID